MSSDILIVDDEADIRELVAGILQDEGHGARTAKNSDEALAAIGARRPTTLVGKSTAMNQLRQTIEKVAPTNSRILIVGPSGAGKELTARTIHVLSGRSQGPFVVINAAAMMPERMEEELFGIEASN